jgi:hypothetical protein
MFKFILLMSVLLSSSMVFAQNQSPGEKFPIPPAGGNGGRSKQDDPGANLPEEMRSRMAIEREERDYQKLVDSANQLSDLSADVAKLYKQSSGLTPEQVRKLASIEKLARHVLSESGGEEVTEKIEQDHLSVPEAVDKLATTAADVKKCVATQTRFVVSATVIANSNDIIHLAQYIRRARK